MAIQSTKQLVEVRLLTTREVLGKLDSTIIELAIEEILAIKLDGKADTALSPRERIFVADLAAVKVLRQSLDRYKEDSKAKAGPDGIVDEAQDKLKYIKELINQYLEEAKELAGKLGLTATGYPPPLVIKVGAATETED